MTTNEKLWRLLRAATKETHPPHCANCLTDFAAGKLNAFHVDHVFPKSIWPERALDPFNTQLLCPDCNRIKGTAIFRRGPETHQQIKTATRFINSLIDLVRFQQTQLDLMEQLNQAKLMEQKKIERQ
jgi:5-methylcytosine-specific restriction endonuclease McrA